MVTAIEPRRSHRGAGAATWLRDSAAAAFGASVLPAVATIGSPVHAPIWQGVAGVLIAVLVVKAATGAARSWRLPPIGVFAAGAACWLLAQASYPVAAWLIAPALGLGIAFAAGEAVRPVPWRLSAISLFAVALAATCITAVRLAEGRDAAMAGGAAIVTASALVSAQADRRGVAPKSRDSLLLVIGAPFVVLVTAAYVGATTPSVTWFGSLIHHGPRGGDEVAITFDDGPNPPYTLQISGILDRYGVKATFFTVGKALEARPDISKALLDDGQLLGNHSYSHDAFRWLDPRYPELEQTQAAFKRTLKVCPALYRPPHGSHTPFMARQVSDEGMKMVTWDVSAADWATSDGSLVARRVLDKVKPGSIILLHDGIDGKIGADRSVILTALPLILDGLRERGLKPVTLDRLLDVPGYVDSC